MSVKRDEEICIQPGNYYWFSDRAATYIEPRCHLVIGVRLNGEIEIKGIGWILASDYIIKPANSPPDMKEVGK